MQTDNSSETYYNQGIKEYEEGQYDLAINNFKKAIEIDDSNFDYYFNLGAAYIKIEKYDSAIENFNNGMKINPKDIELYLNLGLAYYNNGDFDKAAKAYKKTVWLNSSDPENFNNTGVAYCALGNFKEAATNFKHAIRIEPKNQDYCYNFAYACYEIKKYDTAEEYLVNVINFDKQREEAYLLLGKVYIKQSNYDLALDNFQKLLSINPEHEEAPGFIEKIKARKPGQSIEIAETQIEAPEKEEPKNEQLELENQIKIDHYINSATRLFEDKKYKEAVIEFRNVLALKKDHAEAFKKIDIAKKRIKEANELSSKGLGYFNKNEFSQAIFYLEKALNICPHSEKISALKKKAIAKNKAASKKLIESENYEQAIDSLNTIIKQNPDDSEAHFSLGNVHIKQKNFDLALDSFRNTLSLEPDNEEVQNAVYSVINKLNSNHTKIDTYMQIGLFFVEKQEYSKGIRYIEMALEINPDNAEAKTILEQTKSKLRAK